MSTINHEINPLDEQRRHRHYLGLPTATVIAWGGIVNQVDAFDYSFCATIMQSIKGSDEKPCDGVMRDARVAHAGESSREREVKLWK